MIEAGIGRNTISIMSVSSGQEYSEVPNEKAKE
jgi:hypothetical protein